MYFFSFAYHTTTSIRIVADCGTQIFQFTMNLKRATTLEFIAISPINYIACCPLLLSIISSSIFSINFFDKGNNRNTVSSS